MINQISDLCPHCSKDKLVYVGESQPYGTEYLWCCNCNSTFSINYKQMWNEDVNSLTCSMHNVLENEFNERGMKLSTKKSDEIFEKIQGLLEEFSTGDYRNYN